MYRVLQILKKRSIGFIVHRLVQRAKSEVVRKKYNYPVGFFIDEGTNWSTGSSARIGENFTAGKRCRIDVIHRHQDRTYRPLLQIGKNVSLNDDVHIACAGAVTIGDQVLMASKIYISDHNHGNYSGPDQDAPSSNPNDRPLRIKDVTIGDRVWIGEMVSVLPGVTIGNGAIIGSNSVVSRDIPENCIAVGVPARVVKIYDPRQKCWVGVGEVQ